MDFERRHSSGVAKAGLTTGIIGTSLATLGILGGGSALLGGWGNARGNSAQTAMDVVALEALAGNGRCGCGCNENQLVTRYDAQKDARIAELESAVALRDANTYTDQKSIALYQYVDGRLRDIEAQICQQAVVNQANSDRFALTDKNIQCCCDRLEAAIQAERAARCCNDNIIVNYANATFYPQQIADITVSTTTTREKTYNPLPNCGQGCCGSNNGINAGVNA